MWGRSFLRRLVGLAVVGLALLTASSVQAQIVQAQVNGDPAEGHKIATTWCSNCHVVDPDAKTATSTGAPTFYAIAQMESVTPMGLSVFLQTPHSRMPDLHLMRSEKDDLIAYIMSLRKK